MLLTTLVLLLAVSHIRTQYPIPLARNGFSNFAGGFSYIENPYTYDNPNGTNGLILTRSRLKKLHTTPYNPYAYLAPAYNNLPAYPHDNIRPPSYTGLPASACSCGYIFKPVCGSDNKTYNNECLCTCAGLTVARSGDCFEPAPAPKLPKLPEINCHCNSDYSPVCGYNGVTYQNSCLARCDDQFGFLNGNCV